VLLLTILQFFLDFGEAVLHDADGSLKIFFRSCLSREFADPIVAERTLEFLVANKTKILSSFPTLIPQVHKREMITYSEIVNNACRSRLL